MHLLTLVLFLEFSGSRPCVLFSQLDFWFSVKKFCESFWSKKMWNGRLEWLRILKVLRSLSFFPISVSHTMLMTLVSLVVSFLFHMQVSAIDAFSVSLLFGLKLLLMWVDDLGPVFLYYFSPFFFLSFFYFFFFFTFLFCR